MVFDWVVDKVSMMVVYLVALVAEVEVVWLVTGTVGWLIGKRVARGVAWMGHKRTMVALKVVQLGSYWAAVKETAV